MKMKLCSLLVHKALLIARKRKCKRCSTDYERTEDLSNKIKLGHSLQHPVMAKEKNLFEKPNGTSFQNLLYSIICKYLNFTTGDKNDPLRGQHNK